MTSQVASALAAARNADRSQHGPASADASVRFGRAHFAPSQEGFAAQFGPYAGAPSTAKNHHHLFPLICHVKTVHSMGLLRLTQACASAARTCAQPRKFRRAAWALHRCSIPLPVLGCRSVLFMVGTVRCHSQGQPSSMINGNKTLRMCTASWGFSESFHQHTCWDHSGIDCHISSLQGLSSRERGPHTAAAMASALPRSTSRPQLHRTRTLSTIPFQNHLLPQSEPS
jgi:hypothetical protein